LRQAEPGTDTAGTLALSESNRFVNKPIHASKVAALNRVAWVADSKTQPNDTADSHKSLYQEEAGVKSSGIQGRIEATLPSLKKLSSVSMADTLERITAKNKTAPSRKGPGRPSTGVSRQEQSRRQVQERRSKVKRIEIELSEIQDAEVALLAANHPQGKKGWVTDLVLAELTKSHPSQKAS
jgi:hypothetical protein